MKMHVFSHLFALRNALAWFLTVRASFGQKNWGLRFLGLRSLVFGLRFVDTREHAVLEN